MSKMSNLNWSKASSWFEGKPVEMGSNLYYNYMYLLNLSDSQNIIEVGCGVGNGIPIIARFSNAHITAIDNSELMVKIASNKEFPRTQVVLANTEALPYADDSFDAYIANLTLHVTEHPEQLVAEAFRVLQPGKIAVFSVPGKESDSSLFNLMFTYMKIAFYGRSPFHFADPEVLRPLLLNAGFSRVYCYHTVVPFTTVDEEEINELMDSSPLAQKCRNEPDFKVNSELVSRTISEQLAAGKVFTLGATIALAIK